MKSLAITTRFAYCLTVLALLGNAGRSLSAGAPSVLAPVHDHHSLSKADVPAVPYDDTNVDSSWTGMRCHTH